MSPKERVGLKKTAARERQLAQLWDMPRGDQAAAPAALDWGRPFRDGAHRQIQRTGDQNGPA